MYFRYYCLATAAVSCRFCFYNLFCFECRSCRRHWFNSMLTFKALNGLAPSYITYWIYMYRRVHYDLPLGVYWRFLGPIPSMATDHFPSVHQHFGIAYQIIWDLQQLLTYVLLSVISRLCFMSPFICFISFVMFDLIFSFRFRIIL